MDAFSQSTQYRYWYFAPSDVQAMRKRTHATCAPIPAEEIPHRRRDAPEEEAEERLGAVSISEDTAAAAGAAGPSSWGDSSSDSEDGLMTASMPPPPQDGAERPRLTLAEERLLRTYREAVIIKVAGKFKFSDDITASAVTLFKRFYLVNPLAGHNPARVAAACVFLACKAEEATIRLHDLERAAKVKQDAIKALELPLLEGVRFHLRFFHPYKPLDALARRLAPAVGGDDLAEQLLVRARKLVRFSLYTDMMLLEPPSRIALAAMHRACQGAALGEAFARLVREHVAPTPAGAADRLLRAVTQLSGHFQDGSQLAKDVKRLSEKQVKALHDKLKAARNPMYDPGSAAFKAHVAAKRAARQERHAARARKRKMEMDGVLGGKGEEGNGGGGDGGDDGDDAPFVIHSRVDSVPLPKRRRGAGSETK